MTKEQAIKLGKSKWWKNKPFEIVARFQLNEEFICMDFSDFREAVEKSLNRNVWTHEFVNPKALLDELNGKRKAPTMQEIIEILPEAKRILVEI